MIAAQLLQSALIISSPAQIVSYRLPPLALRAAQPEEGADTSDTFEEPGVEPDAPPEELGDEPADAETGETDSSAAPPPGDPSAAPPPAETSKRKHKEWNLQLQPGGEFLVAGTYTAYGPAFRFAAWKQGWRGGFMVGGGPALHYGYMIDPAVQDRLGILTFNGDFIIGGGSYEKFAVFFHATLGLGLLHASDGATDTSFLLPGFRATAGVGGYGKVTERISIGALVDFGYYGAIGIDAMITLGFHFGK